MREDHDARASALKLGARGYVLKGVGGARLVEIVRAVHDGGFYVEGATLVQRRSPPGADSV